MPDQVQIEQIRYELTWRVRQNAMYPDLPLEASKLPLDPEGIHFGLYAGDWLTAVVSLFNNGQNYQFRKFATLTKEQGKGYGSKLLSYIISYVQQEGGTSYGVMPELPLLDFMRSLALAKQENSFMIKA
jgi:GNAT superfamily N-acetyltransferase